MVTILNKPKALVFGGILMLLLIVLVALAPKAQSCPLVQLSSPPSSIKICSSTCSGTNICNRSCENTLTLNNTACPNYTWTFTDNTSGCVTIFHTSGATLNFTLRGSVGDSISLVIQDGAGGSSVTYNFSTTSC